MLDANFVSDSDFNWQLDAHIVQFDRKLFAPNLVKILNDENVTKFFIR